MQDINISLTIFQAAVVVSLLILAIGVAKPGWILFWMKNSKRFYMFLIGLLLFMGSYFAFSLKMGNPIPIAAIHAVVLSDVLFLVIGLINPSWVFGTEKLDRLWVSIIAVLLFMGLMTLQGMYYGPKNKRRINPPTAIEQPQPAPNPDTNTNQVPSE